MIENRKSPLVSVIMIFLNAEKFIQEAIESVLAQTYLNWELILVDDGSTDKSTEIAREYTRRYLYKIRYVEHQGHQNCGMSASRNLGIRVSDGEYIAFLDADDIYLPEKLEKQVDLFGLYPTVAMTYGTTQYWYSWTGEPNDQRLDSMRRLGVPTGVVYDPPELMKRFLKNSARTPATCSVLIRRKAVEAIGGFEESFKGMFEDQVFFYKLCLHERVYVESGCTSRYRQHLESYCYVNFRTGKWDPGHRLSPTRAAFLHWLEMYLAEQKVGDPKIWRMLQKQLWSYRHPQLYSLISTFYRLGGALRTRVRGLLQSRSSQI